MIKQTNIQITLETLAQKMRQYLTCALIDDQEGWGKDCPDCEGESEVLRWSELTEGGKDA